MVGFNNIGRLAAKEPNPPRPPAPVAVAAAPVTLPIAPAIVPAAEAPPPNKPDKVEITEFAVPNMLITPLTPFVNTPNAVTTAPILTAHSTMVAILSI